jgi:hypothetical protein
MAARASRARGLFQCCGEREGLRRSAVLSPMSARGSGVGIAPRNIEGAQRKMAFTVNGCGTTLYGNADAGPDGSCIVATWVVLVYIPLIPLGSMRVLPVSQAHLPWYKRSGQRYRSIKVPLHVPHPWKGWGVTVGIVLFFAIIGRH